MSSKSLMRPSCICTEARKRASLLTCVSCSSAHLAWSITEREGMAWVRERREGEVWVKVKRWKGIENGRK